MVKIKFRVWDKENKRMLVPGEDNDYIALEIDENGINVYDMQHLSAEKGYDLAHLDCELMQSTGRKDKNGVDIFEGDIVKGRTNGLSCYGTVFYDDERYYRFSVEDAKRGRLYGMESDWKLEVIGNKYQNPELLEGK